MSSLMVAFRSTFDTVTETQLRAEMNQNVRSVMDQLNRELSQALVNNNRPVGEQIYFQIKQLSPDQSVIRFGCTQALPLLKQRENTSKVTFGRAS